MNCIFHPGDRVTWTVLKKVGGTFDWHSYANVAHAGVVEEVETKTVRVKVDGSGRVVALAPAALRHITPPLQDSNPPPPC